jgi:hypothetical protein
MGIVPKPAPEVGKSAKISVGSEEEKGRGERWQRSPGLGGRGEGNWEGRIGLRLERRQREGRGGEGAVQRLAGVGGG